MYNKEKTMDNKLFIYENINIFGFNNQTGPILVHIYPLFFNNNLHVKYRSNQS